MSKISSKCIIDLPLKKEWYNMIESGFKREEYREFKPYWVKRIFNQGIPKPFTHVRFRYGYTRRTMTFKIDSIKIGFGNVEWGAPCDEIVIIIKFY